MFFAAFTATTFASNARDAEIMFTISVITFTFGMLTYPFGSASGLPGSYTTRGGAGSTASLASSVDLWRRARHADVARIPIGFGMH